MVERTHTIVKAKKDLGFKKHKVVKKPKLSHNPMTAREKMAQEEKCSSLAAYIKKNSRTVFGDEKWSSLLGGEA